MKKESNAAEKHNSKIVTTLVCCSILLILLLAVFSMFYFHYKIVKAGLEDNSKYNYYNKHYVLITNNDSDPVWDSIYKGALEEAVKDDAYVEYMGKNLSSDYSELELLRIAIDSKVDGIIMEGNENADTVKLINEAVENGIVVTTVLHDSTQSTRQSFVGVNSYNLGKEYGEQVLELCNQNTKRVFVLMDTNATDTIQNIVYLGIKEAIEKERRDDQISIQAIAVNNETAFSAEESIRDIIMDTNNLPDIMICLNSVNSKCAYQAVVDYNKVGQIQIIGNYDSETVLSAIQKKIIYSTLSIDAKQMGHLCAKALSEYIDTGHVSGYLSVDTKLINADNVQKYIEENKAQKVTSD